MHVTNHGAASSGIGLRIRTLGERMRTHLRRNDESGQSLVEFAVCVPVLLLVLTGIMTFAVALNNYMVMTNAVSASALVLSVDRNNSLTPCQDASNAFVNAAPTLKASSLKFTYSLNGVSYGPYTGKTAGSSCTSSSLTTGAAGNLVAGQSAQITVTYPCNLSVYGHNFVPSCNLQVQTTEIVQ